MEDLAEKAMGYHTKTVCSDCTDGRVSFGPLAVGVAAHKCDASGCGDGYHEPAGCPNCIDCTEPAALTENITVQAYPVVEYADAYEGPCIEKNHGRITWWADPFDQRGTEPEDITDQFPVLPKPGDTVCRVIERRALTEPITEYPHSVEWRGHTAQMATVPLPQGVGSGCTEPTRR